MIFLASSANLDHLYRLTDNTGIRPTTDPSAGYRLDHNAQALAVAIRALTLTRESGLIDYARHYLAFLEQAQRSDGTFRGVMAGAGHWMDETASDDAGGQAIWALGFAALRSVQTEVRVRALRCLDGALPGVAELSSHEGQAWALMGLRDWQQAEASSALDVAIEQLTNDLGQIDLAAPGVARALLGTKLGGAALKSLAATCEGLMAEGYLDAELPAQASGLVAACALAHRVSGDERFRRWAELAYGWFRGENAGRRSMLDPHTGGCYDRLTPGGPEEGQGAEALLAWLLAWEEMEELSVGPGAQTSG